MTHHKMPDKAQLQAARDEMPDSYRVATCDAWGWFAAHRNTLRTLLDAAIATADAPQADEAVAWQIMLPSGAIHSTHSKHEYAAFHAVDGVLEIRPLYAAPPAPSTDGEEGNVPQEVLDLIKKAWRDIKPTVEAQHCRSAIKIDSGKHKYTEADLLPGYVWDIADISAQIAIDRHCTVAPSTEGTDGERAEALDQALRQWKMYSETQSGEAGDLATADHAEGQLYRKCKRALAQPDHSPTSHAKAEALVALDDLVTLCDDSLITASELAAKVRRLIAQPSPNLPAEADHIRTDENGFPDDIMEPKDNAAETMEKAFYNADGDIKEVLVTAALDAFEEDQCRAPSQKKRAISKALRAAVAPLIKPEQQAGQAEGGE